MKAKVTIWVEFNGDMSIYAGKSSDRPIDINNPSYKNLARYVSRRDWDYDFTMNEDGDHEFWFEESETRDDGNEHLYSLFELI